MLGVPISLFCGLESVLRIDRKALTGEGGGAEGGAPGGEEEEEEEDEDGMFKIDLPSVARQARMSDEEASELESRGGEILFGAFQFVRDGSHKAYCFISWIGPEVSVVKRGRAVSATLEVAHFSLLTSHLNL